MSSRFIDRECMKGCVTRLAHAGLAASALTACSKPMPNLEQTLYSDSAGIQIAYTRIDSTAPACQLGESARRIGTRVGDPAYELFNVRGAVRLESGDIAVLNAGSSQVKVFDTEAKLVTEFGRRGQGPGEFKSLWTMDVSGRDTLVIGEYRPWRFSFFRVDGEFLRSVEVRPPIVERPEIAFALSQGKGFLVGERCCFTGEQGFIDETVRLARYNADGSLTDTIRAFWLTNTGFLDAELRYAGGPVFGARAAFAKLGPDTLVYAPGQSEQVELWTPDGGLHRIIRWNARDRRVRRDDVAEWKRQYRERFPGDLSSPEARLILEAQVGDHRPVADVFPAHEEWGALLVSRDGLIWVKEFKRPFDEGVSRWLVFYSSGAFACQLMVPEEIDLLDVGKDYVLGRERDIFEVEYVVERTYRWPTATSES
jgi:hypothetical protein